jgi:hypothetical protein
MIMINNLFSIFDPSTSYEVIYTSYISYISIYDIDYIYIFKLSKFYLCDIIYS